MIGTDVTLEFYGANVKNNATQERAVIRCNKTLFILKSKRFFDKQILPENENQG